jgi:membrane protein DedA with SNARE-associated domain
VTWFHVHSIAQLISTYGYFAVGAIVALEGMGLPLPGETVLLFGALYASRHPELNIWGVIGAAAIGAVLGPNVGYWIGREFGYPLLVRFGPHIGMSHARIKLGQYLFKRHGGKVVFFGRFVAVLRVVAAILAGVNRMDWRGFFIANAVGAILWAVLFGFPTYMFGRAVFHVRGSLALAFLIPAIIIIVLALRYIRMHEAELQKQANAEFPGPLEPADWARKERHSQSAESP